MAHKERSARRKPESLQTGRGEDHGIKFSLGHATDAGGHIPADRDHFRITAQSAHHAGPPRAARPDSCSCGQAGRAAGLSSDQHVACRPAWQNRAEDQTGRKIHGQIFQAVHRGRSAAVEKRRLQFLGEDPGSAQRSEILLRMPVTGRAYHVLTHRELRPGADQAFAHHACLHAGQLAATRREDEVGHDGSGRRREGRALRGTAGKFRDLCSNDRLRLFHLGRAQGFALAGHRF